MGGSDLPTVWAVLVLQLQELVGLRGTLDAPGQQTTEVWYMPQWGIMQWGGKGWLSKCNLA